MKIKLNDQVIHVSSFEQLFDLIPWWNLEARVVYELWGQIFSNPTEFMRLQPSFQDIFKFMYKIPGGSRLRIYLRGKKIFLMSC